MPATSEARSISSRKNGARSKGPTSPAGKTVSRRNGLKHGMTGAGIVLTDEDALDVEVRAAALMAELDPQSIIGEAMVGQLAILWVRMQRGSKYEEEALASRVRLATETFDYDRVDRVEELFDTIGDNPRCHLRLLRRMPEGVDRLLEAWGQLRGILVNPNRIYWDASIFKKITRLLGLRPDEARGSAIDSLCLIIQGKYPDLPDPACLGLDQIARRDWARDRLVERIDTEVDGLNQHRGTLNLKAIELDRLGAPTLALFDLSPDGNLARRYESEARRMFFKCLKEFHAAEAEMADEPSADPIEVLETQPVPKPDPQPNPAPASEPLGSSCATRSAEPREPKPSLRDELAELLASDPAHAKGRDGRVVAIAPAIGEPR
jgi:hypothetical protein